MRARGAPRLTDGLGVRGSRLDPSRLAGVAARVLRCRLAASIGPLSLVALGFGALLAPSCASSPGPATPPGGVEPPTRPPDRFDALVYRRPDGTPRVERAVRLPELGLEPAPRVRYVARGPEDGAPVLLLHGLGSHLGFWAEQIEPLAAAGFRVVAIDMLGFGKSDKPAAFAYDTPSMVEVVLGVMASLELDRAAVVGHSMGGQVGLRMAIDYPGRVSRLVLLAPAGLEPFSEAERAALLPLVTEAGVTGLSPEAIRTQTQLNFARWRPELEWLIEDRIAMRDFSDLPDYARAQVMSFRGLLDTEPTRAGAARLGVPTLVVYGGEDRLIPNRALHPQMSFETLVADLVENPRAQVERVEGCGHLIQLDCPSATNALMLGFLRR